jgi:3-hydroxyisobutyrate dehydrogenase-like beta-hydroxyacid dehydrogenase
LDPELPVAMRIDTVLKDLDLILSLGQSTGVPLTATEGVKELFAQAQAAGYQSKDMSALFRFISQS